MIFNAFINSVTREAKRQFFWEVKLSTGDIGPLLFVDDMVVMAESVERVQHNFTGDEWHAELMWAESELVKDESDEDCTEERGSEVKIGEEVLGQVDTMNYLGVMISSDERVEKTVKVRWGCNTGDGRIKWCSIEKEAIEQEHQTESSEFHSDANIMVWLWVVDSIKATAS